MATRTHTIKIGLTADTSGLSNISSALTEIKGQVDELNGTTLSIQTQLDFDESSLKNLKSQIESIGDTKIKPQIDVKNKAEKELKNIKDQADSIKDIDIPINVEDNATAILATIMGSAVALGDTLGKIDVGGFKNIDSGLGKVVKEIQSVESSIGGLQKSLNGIQINTGDVGVGKLVNGIEDAMGSVANLQNQLDSLHAPDIQMPDFYANYGANGEISFGALGGSNILRMLGVGSVSSLTWGNAAANQLNTQLIPKMPKGKHGESLGAKTYEGGEQDIFHAVTQSSLTRRTNLIPATWRFAITADASYEELMKPLNGAREDTYWGLGTGIDYLSKFGETAQLLEGGSEVKATTAISDLAKGYGKKGKEGAFASIDQYGISEATLARVGYDTKKEHTVSEYLEAVGKVLEFDKENDIIANTTEGGITKLRKKFNNAGQKIGNMLMGPVDSLVGVVTRLNDATGGLFAQAVIVATGLWSVWGPLKKTVGDIVGTIKGVPGNIKNGVLGLRKFTDYLSDFGGRKNFGNLDKFGKDSILKSSSVELGKSAYDKIQDTSNIRGIHDYDNLDEVIDNARLSKGDKKRLKAEAHWDDKIFKARDHSKQYKTIDKEIDKQLGITEAETNKRKELFSQLKHSTEFKDPSTGQLNLDGLEEAVNRRMENWKLSKEDEWNEKRTPLRDKARSAYEKGEKNRINQEGKWGKFKEHLGGLKDDFSIIDNYRKGRNDKKDEISSKGKTKKKGITGAISNIFGGAKNAIAPKTSGLAAAGQGLLSGLGGIGSALMGLGSSIGVATIALAGLASIAVVLGAMFMVAFNHSKAVQEQVGRIMEKVGTVFDSLMYGLGDILYSLGLSGSGGIDGVVEVVSAILGVVEGVLDGVNALAQAITGRDIKQAKGVSEGEEKVKEAKKAWDEQYAKNGGDVPDAYSQDLANAIQQIYKYDRTYFGEVDEKGHITKWNEENLEKLGMNDDVSKGLIKHTTDEQVDQNMWQYQKDEQLQSVNDLLGTNFTPYDLPRKPGDSQLFAKMMGEGWLKSVSGGYLGKDPNQTDYYDLYAGTRVDPRRFDAKKLPGVHDSEDMNERMWASVSDSAYQDYAAKYGEGNVIGHPTYDANATLGGMFQNAVNPDSGKNVEKSSDTTAKNTGNIDKNTTITPGTTGQQSLDSGGVMGKVLSDLSPFLTFFGSLPTGSAAETNEDSAISSYVQAHPNVDSAGNPISPSYAPTTTPGAEQTATTPGTSTDYGSQLTQVQTLTTQLSGLETQINTTLTNITTNLSASLTNLTTAVSESMSTVGQTFMDSFSQIQGTVQGFVDSMVNGLTQVQTIMTNINTGVTTLGTGLTNATSQVTMFGTMAMTGFMMASMSLLMLNTTLLQTSMALTQMMANVGMIQSQFMMIANVAMMISQYLMMGNMALTQMMGTAMMMNQTFLMFGQVVMASMFVAIAAIQMFSSQAIALMGTTGAGMVAAFTGSFHGVAAAVNAEMAAAYAAMAAWGAMMIALAAAIGAAIAAAIRAGLNMGSPGDVFRAVRDEFTWTYQIMSASKGPLVTMARSIGSGIVQGFRTGYLTDESGVSTVWGNDLNTMTGMGVNPSTSLNSNYNASPVSPVNPVAPVQAPQVTQPQGNGNNQAGTTINNNLHVAGYGDYEELAKVVIQVINEKFLFEVEKAGRTV